ncbi:uncharacterized protein BP5553_08995 [Venustampulla echinocandica]|uniref:Uncharacterized protein n=1 Tax=Venustampulla echinocandica TaxID=2656787 RepID=A0A370TDJ6_9HELO|nr:uncharacterized protein BP5553_08995 [Venustampulla echinocandica]RDL32539.1 hypothetical protein BP5553_08995 [Venustampulla echinocandica]
MRFQESVAIRNLAYGLAIPEIILSTNALSTSEDLIRETISVQNSASLVLPAISWVAFALGILSLILLRRFDWDGLAKATQILLWGSTACSFAAAWSVTYIVAAMDAATTGSRQARIVKGPALMALQWSTFAFVIFITCLVHIITTNPASSAKATSKPSTPPTQPPPPKGPPPPTRPPPSKV